MRKLLKRTGFIAVSAVALTSVGIAFAAWTSTGSGDGSAASEPNQALTFSSATVVDKLYPTGDGSVEFSVLNPNHYDVRLGNISITSVYDVLDVGNANPADDKTNVMSTCDLTYVAPSSYTSSNFLIQNDALAQVVNLPGALTMGNNAVNSCAGKTFGVVLSATTASE